MNRKTAVIASGVVAIGLLTGCTGTNSYEYQVSGSVKDQQVDYDCPGEDIAMESVGFDARTSGGSGGRSSSRSGGSSKPSGKKSGGDSRSSDRGSQPSDRKSDDGDKRLSSGNGGSTGGGSTGGKVNVKKPSQPKNAGVKLDKKPESPEKVKKVSKFSGLTKGCKNEYEIFVLDKKGNLYEQDVRKVDYDHCLKAKVPSGQKAKLFPLCTKG